MLDMLRRESVGNVGLAEQSLGDVTSWFTYWAPDDGQAIHDAVLAQVQDAAAKQATVYSSQFGFTDQDIADAFAAAGVAQPLSRFLFDKSQEAGTYERPIVQGLVSKLQPDQWAIGTSSDAGQILHLKAVAILYLDGTGWTFSGSYNLSSSASRQLNIADLISSRSRAEVFVQQIGKMLMWVQQNEPNYQTP